MKKPAELRREQERANGQAVTVIALDLDAMAAEYPTKEEVEEIERELQALLYTLWNPQKEIC